MNELQHKQINKRENDNFILNVPSTQNEKILMNVARMKRYEKLLQKILAIVRISSL